MDQPSTSRSWRRKYHGTAYQGDTQVGSNGRPVGHLMDSPFPFRQHGQCGRWVSSVFPQVARCVDDLAFVFGLRAKGRADGYHELPRPVLL